MNHDRRESQLKCFVRDLIAGRPFNFFIITIIMLNVISIAVQTDDGIYLQNILLFTAADLVFLAVYTIEFVLKLYAGGYWSVAFNRFDFVILVFSYIQLLEIALAAFAFFRNFQFLRVLRAFRALRALRSISFIRSLQVIVKALLSTILELMNLFFLLLLMMYTFAVVAYYLWGSDPGPQNAVWGNLGSILLALFAYVTADGWTDLQSDVDTYSLYTRFYAVLFVFIGNFIFTNLFIGLVIQNLDDATEEDSKARHDANKDKIQAQKLMYRAKQKKELEEALRGRETDTNVTDIHALIQARVGRLNHRDQVVMTSTECNLTWLETYLATLNHVENTMYRDQQMHFEMANTLASMLEHRLDRREREG
eukprot:TRINITY_DN15083_c0_g1_i1.p1 TRINITY_DN15083_c0_g1~~TRINITY_DN15083_c0_g1_i1.p1  ORF type:complete len:366 (+),score=64.47 TRINITY_DN15083_c0_g1_i1:25-1122(+)